MSEQATSPEGERRTIAAKVSPELRTRFDSVVELTGLSVNDALTAAIENWMAAQLSDPELRKKALDQIDAAEQELQARRAQIQGLLGEGAVGETAAPKRRKA